MVRIILFCLLAFTACTKKEYDNPHLIITTELGDIEIEVYPDKAPETSKAFLVNTTNGLYANASFYRVLKADDVPSNVSTGLIQGGVYKSGKNKNMPGIMHESTARSGLTHTDGTVSMARTEPGTATTEFFICIGDQSPLDSGRRGTPDGLGMAAFGKVFKGMDVVRKIQDQKNNGDVFERDVVIKNIRRL